MLKLRVKNLIVIINVLLIVLIFNTSCTKPDEDLNKVNINTVVTDETTPSISSVLINDETTSLESQNKIDEIFKNMTLEEKIYQMFVVTPEQLTGLTNVTQSDDNTKLSLESKPVGGIIYFSDNIQTEEQVTDMVFNTQQFIKDINNIGLFMAIDEEGGKIARIGNNLNTATKLQPMDVYGQNVDKNEAYNIGSTLAKDLTPYGFNVDFAPVADVDLNTNNGLHKDGRCFSDNPEVVALMVENVVKGLQDNNVSSTLKHFPGLGSTNGDTHDGAVFLQRSKEDFQNIDFIPFKAGINAGADFVMVSHMIVDGLSDNLPCDLSKTIVTDWLRNELNFDGIVITDSHMMGAITENYSSGEASLMAINAGVDIVLMPEDLESSFYTVYRAVTNGDISEDRIDESVLRILSLKDDMGILY